jgi:xanthine phosphoribosyltransferase
MIDVYYSDKDIDGMVHDIIRAIILSNWLPDYVVGITRGGLIPALYISHYFDIPMETLKISLKDESFGESKCWMAEEAFGYVNSKERQIVYTRWDISKRKNILIIDDIVDQGETFDWIKNDWMNCCFPDEKEAWNSVWHNNVKFASLVYNEACNFPIDFYSEGINKEEIPQWAIFPWEEWWKDHSCNSGVNFG